MHRLAQRFGEVVQQEATGLFGDVRQRGGVLDWEGFADAWFRIVRRVVFGDAARDDRALRALVNRLRADGNWAFFRPKRERLVAELLRRIREHLARAEPGSLAAVIATTPTTPATAPEQQVPQWLFAFDASAMATFRALALLASHPDQASKATQELQARPDSAWPELPYLRACILESVRLWPTTPVILRQTTRSTEWDTGTLPAGTGMVVFVPFFPRDDQRLGHAPRFTPQLWLGA